MKLLRPRQNKASRSVPYNKSGYEIAHTFHDARMKAIGALLEI